MKFLVWCFYPYGVKVCVARCASFDEAVDVAFFLCCHNVPGSISIQEV